LLEPPRTSGSAPVNSPPMRAENVHSLIKTYDRCTANDQSGQTWPMVQF
jgi:hypothetical protein